MMPPGHVAFTWAVSDLLQKNESAPDKLDYRLLALSAMLPDFIDKPLAMFVFTRANTSQLVAHSLPVNALLLVLALLRWPKAIPYVLAFNGHLIADRMWRHTESFWWPFFGWNRFWQFKFMNSPEAMLSVYWDIITRYPQVWVVELLAGLYLGWFAYRRHLHRWARLRCFLTTGWTSARAPASDFESI